MSKDLSITIKLKNNIPSLEYKIERFVKSNLDTDKASQTREFFLKSINQIIENGQKIAAQDGNMKFEKSIEHEGLTLNIKANFSNSESLIEKILSIFK